MSYLKSISYALLFTFAFGFFACSKNDHPAGPNQDEILREKVLGTWIQTKIESQLKKEDGSPDGDKTITEEEYKSGEYGIRFEEEKYFEFYPKIPGVIESGKIDSAKYIIKERTLTLHLLNGSNWQVTRNIEEEEDNLILTLETARIKSKSYYRKK